jgi:hypothetical protein
MKCVSVFALGALLPISVCASAPAVKDGRQVTHWLKVEYALRLESSIFRQ